ncbi:hypothetical protein M9458_047029, partial [Cirrhinus mrigala]
MERSYHPETSPPSPRCAEPKPEPTNDGEPEPTANDKPHEATELRIATKPASNVKPGARASYNAHHKEKSCG